MFDYEAERKAAAPRSKAGRPQLGPHEPDPSLRPDQTSSMSSSVANTRLMLFAAISCGSSSVVRFVDGVRRPRAALGRWSSARDGCRLVLGDTGPFEVGELCAAWVGDRPDQGWRSLYVESCEAGRVIKAKWLRNAWPLSKQDKRLLTEGKMWCLR